jgi:hypothetical protein
MLDALLTDAVWCNKLRMYFYTFANSAIDGMWCAYGFETLRFIKGGSDRNGIIRIERIFDVFIGWMT